MIKREMQTSSEHHQFQEHHLMPANTSNLITSHPMHSWYGAATPAGYHPNQTGNQLPSSPSPASSSPWHHQDDAHQLGWLPHHHHHPGYPYAASCRDYSPPSNGTPPAGMTYFAPSNQHFIDGSNTSATIINSSSEQHQIQQQQYQQHFLSYHQHHHQLPSSPAMTTLSGSDASSPASNNASPLSQTRPAHTRSPYRWLRNNQKPPTGKTRTKDKYRVVYSDHQRIELEKEFYYSRYITIRRKSELATTLGLSERQVKIWFQNRRAKERKQVKKREECTQEDNKSLIHQQILHHHQSQPIIPGVI